MYYNFNGPGNVNVFSDLLSNNATTPVTQRCVVCACGVMCRSLQDGLEAVIRCSVTKAATCFCVVGLTERLEQEGQVPKKRAGMLLDAEFTEVVVGPVHLDTHIGKLSHDLYESVHLFDQCYRSVLQVQANLCGAIEVIHLYHR